jgi:peptide/nickel transport system substrate-binding protein
MIDGNKKRDWQKIVHHRRRDAAALGQQADEHLEKLLINRFDRLVSVRQFVVLWISLFVLLIFCSVLQIRALSPYYQTLKPAPGGLYNEGLIGAFTNANPLYAAGTVDTAVSHLIFSGLFKYSSDNKLTGDLAKDWSLNNNQTNYTVHLRPNLYWHDGEPLTADDVLFTYHTIQNTAAQSSLYSSWKGINITKLDTYTVNFALPNALSSFPYALTNGIIPAHLLNKIQPQELRSTPFNSAPIGSGPFIWKFIETTGNTSAERQQRISLAANDNYWAGRPKLDGLSLITFSDDQHMISAFAKKQLNAMSGLESLPDQFKGDGNIQTYVTPLTSAVMAFFNNSQAVLSDVNVRKALVSGINRNQIPSLFDNPIKLVDEPFLHGQLGYDPAFKEPAYNLTNANSLLDAAGWLRDDSGVRYKNGDALSLNLSSQNTQEYTQVAHLLQKQWGQLGVKVTVHYYNADDLQGSIVANHDYDILLYGISLGVDPDVFSYWDSSQASLSSQGHLNLSEYKSSDADRALEAARTRADPSVRAPKYKIFLKTWQQDIPALALYQPNFLYITRGPVFNYERKSANSRIDRFYNVDQWMVRQQHQTRD